MSRFFAFCVALCLLTPHAHAFEIIKAKGKTISNQLDEISSERMSQENLPIAKGEFWDKLFKCKVHYNNRTMDYSVTNTDETKALDGKVIQIKGFMYPLSMEEKQKEILLSKRTPVCFFCPPGEPNELLDVKFAKAEELNSNLITVEGRFTMVNKKQEGIFYMLTDAKVVK